MKDEQKGSEFQSTEVEESFWNNQKQEEVPGSAKEFDQIDPELASLPASQTTPKKKHPLLMVLVIAIGIVLIYWLRVDLSYFFASTKPVELGDAMEVNVSSIRSNTYVHITGFPNPNTVVRFSKRLSKGFFRIFPLVGTKKVYVQFKISEEEAQKKRKTSELPGEFTGRAIRFKDLDKTGISGSSYRNIRKFFLDNFLIDIPDDAVLIMDGEHPHSYWPYVLISAVVTILIISNFILLILYIVQKRKKNIIPTQS